MKKLTNKIWAVVLAMMLTVSTISVTPVAAATTTTNTAYVTIEKFTIGQGFLLEPTKVTFNEGDTVEDVVKKAAKENGTELVFTTTSYGSYLSGIKNADNGKVNIPSEISAFGDYETGWDGFSVSYPAPTNDNIKKNENKDGLLGEMCYTDMAGWFYFVNNESISETASNIKVKNGDVIRLQFSIYGYGVDLGSLDYSTGKKKIELANRDDLIVTLANLKASGILEKSKSLNAYYSVSKNQLAQYNAEEENLKDATQAMELLETIFEDGRKAGASEVKPVEKPSVKKATVKSIKNVKGCKAKIKVKTLKNVTGYQFKYATNKSLKNAVVVSTKKTSVTTAKVAKNSKVYVKIRAYVKKDGAYYYGKWSKAKSVKIKK
ncbi:MAG: DUF4430 domain-containing protein [Eubacterium sp.]|nr:DUF4430 domain-containing protein [Eubacterium sp.]